MIPIFLYSDVYELESVMICNILLPQNDYIDAHQAFTLYSFTLGFCAPIDCVFQHKHYYPINQ